MPRRSLGSCSGGRVSSSSRVHDNSETNQCSCVGSVVIMGRRARFWSRRRTCNFGDISTQIIKPCVSAESFGIITEKHQALHHSRIARDELLSKRHAWNGGKTRSWLQNSRTQGHYQSKSRHRAPAESEARKIIRRDLQNLIQNKLKKQRNILLW